MNKALLVGINAYPGSPLRGCVNDVNDMSAFLQQTYGFSQTEITILRDDNATKANIFSALQ